MPRQDYSDPLNPFGDPFKVQKVPRGGLKGPRNPPSPIPESRALFDLQADLLKALSSLERDEYEGKAVRPLRNAYKIINRYLRQYGHGKDEGNPLDVDV